jgi:hypothetical protein
MTVFAVGSSRLSGLSLDGRLLFPHGIEEELPTTTHKGITFESAGVIVIAIFASKLWTEQSTIFRIF